MSSPSSSATGAATPRSMSLGEGEDHLVLPAAPARARPRRAPSRLLNRELSWLDFERRVLELASDSSLPLLERLKLCAIVSANLDEFFAVRIAELAELAASG